MTRLLMLDFDQRLVTVVTRALWQEGVEVVGVSSLERALDRTSQQRFDAALIDCDLIEEGELSAFASLPMILTTAIMEPEGQHRFFRHARLLRKPFTSAQLLSALHETCGSLERDSATLVDVLRRAHSARQDLALNVGGGLLFIERGELVHAELNGVLGERALAEVLALAERTPVPIQGRPAARTIHRPFQALMLDLLRHIDEREQGEPSVLRSSVTPIDKGPRS